MANEFTRITHSVSGGVQLNSINPDVEKNTNYGLRIVDGYVSLPIQGYSKVRLKLYSGSLTARYKEIYSDGTSGSLISQALTDSAYVEITPTSGTVALQFDTFAGGTSNYIIYGLIV